MSGAHSLLAPSDAARWARCAGALLLSKGREKKSSKDAAAGSCTHWLAEQLGRQGTAPEDSIGHELEFDGFKILVDADRAARARTYVENVAREPGARYIEHRLDTSPILGIPGQEGHSDTVTVDPLSMVLIDGVEHKGVISVHDLKDGAGHTVWAKNNLQGLIYGAAALYEFDMVAPFNAVRFCIHQPRLNHYDEWTYSRTEIEHFISIIRPAAKLAYDLYHGNQEFTPAIHLNAGEEQCTWCPVRGGCPARAKRITDMFSALAVKHEIDDATLADIYVKLDELEAAIKDFRTEAYQRALAGHPIAGHKLVLGNRGRRFWKDAAKAESILALTVDEAKLYEPRSIVSPTEIERIIGKKAYKAMDALKNLVDQADGAPTLVPESDKRDPIKPLQFEVLPS
jgi:Protein of unknown function (DUF2800)